MKVIEVNLKIKRRYRISVGHPLKPGDSAFVQKVVDRFDLRFNPDPEINETIIQGLARHQHLHGRRYCPCFIVQFDKALDRICPCKPGLEEEVPRDGHCHCGIFCAKDYTGEPYQPAGGTG